MSEIPSKMRAVTIGAVGDVHVAEYDTPTPKAGEVLIKMTAASICTIDQRAYSGVSSQTGFPTIPGHEGTGVIAAMGEGVKGLKIGDAVIVGRFGCGVCKNCKTKGFGCTEPTDRFEFNPNTNAWGEIGCMSQYLIKPYIHVTKISGDVNPIYAALCEPVSCVVRSVERSRLDWTETAVICGAGIMGLLHVQLAKLKGARVIVSEPDAARRQRALDMGADYAIDPTSQDIVKFIMSVTEKGADVVFNTVANPKVFNQCFDMIGMMGRVVAYSSLHPNEPIPIDVGKLHKAQYELIGTNGSSIEDLYHAAKLVESGAVKLETLVDSTYSIDECEAAFKRACAPDSYRCVFDFSK